MVNSNPAAPPSTREEHRFESLDGWRGVVALWIAMFHLPMVSEFLGLPLIRNAYIIVDFFFVLSGFVIAHTYAGRLKTSGQAGDFIVRRFFRLWPLHAAVLIAWLMAETLCVPVAAYRLMPFPAPPFSTPNDPLAFGLNAVLLSAIGITDYLGWNKPSWSISAEFWTYLAFAAVVLIGRRKPAITAASALIAIAALLVLVLQPRRTMDLTYDFGFVRCLYGFFLGCLVYRIWATVQHLASGIAWLELPVVAAYVAYVCVVGKSPLGFIAPLVSAAAVFVFAFEAGPIARLMKSRPLAWLGRRSYTVYMLHGFVGANLIYRPIQLVEALSGLPLTSGDPGGDRMVALNSEALSGVLVLIYIALILALSAVAYRWIERPGQRLGARLMSRPSREGHAFARTGQNEPFRCVNEKAL